MDSRLHPPTLKARLVRLPDGKLRLESTTVGMYREAPRTGSLVTADTPIGQLEILGVLYHLLAPPGAIGMVLPPESAARLTRRPVGHGDLLVALDPEAATAIAGITSSTTTAAQTGKLVFRAPTAGRWYTRPGPGKPALIELGTIVSTGQAVGLIEVMKTFSRLHYNGGEQGGEGLPPRARITAILVKDEEDVAAGDALFEVDI
jgi:acetyl-CoA carboxylase biotin carboxyl carrier protein